MGDHTEDDSTPEWFFAEVIMPSASTIMPGIGPIETPTSTTLLNDVQQEPAIKCFYPQLLSISLSGIRSFFKQFMQQPSPIYPSLILFKTTMPITHDVEGNVYYGKFQKNISKGTILAYYPKSGAACDPPEEFISFINGPEDGIIELRRFVFFPHLARSEKIRNLGVVEVRRDQVEMVPREDWTMKDFHNFFCPYECLRGYLEKRKITPQCNSADGFNSLRLLQFYCKDEGDLLFSLPTKACFVVHQPHQKVADLIEALTCWQQEKNDERDPTQCYFFLEPFAVNYAAMFDMNLGSVSSSYRLNGLYKNLYDHDILGKLINVFNTRMVIIPSLYESSATKDARNLFMLFQIASLPLRLTYVAGNRKIFAEVHELGGTSVNRSEHLLLLQMLFVTQLRYFDPWRSTTGVIKGDERNIIADKISLTQETGFKGALFSIRDFLHVSIKHFSYARVKILLKDQEFNQDIVEEILGLAILMKELQGYGAAVEIAENIPFSAQWLPLYVQAQLLIAVAKGADENVPAEEFRAVIKILRQRLNSFPATETLVFDSYYIDIQEAQGDIYMIRNEYSDALQSYQMIIPGDNISSQGINAAIKFFKLAQAALLHYINPQTELNEIHITPNHMNRAIELAHKAINMNDFNPGSSRERAAAQLLIRTKRLHGDILTYCKDITAAEKAYFSCLNWDIGSNRIRLVKNISFLTGVVETLPKLQLSHQNLKLIEQYGDKLQSAIGWCFGRQSLRYFEYNLFYVRALEKSGNTAKMQSLCSRSILAIENLGTQDNKAYRILEAKLRELKTGDQD